MAGRPKKITEEVSNTEVSEIVIDKEKEELKKQNSEMMKMLQEMQAKIDSMKSNQTPVIIQQDKGMSGKKIKCMNMLDHPLYVSTQPDGAGKVYAFTKYGQIQQIKYDDLVDIATSYPNTLERGYLYILDKTVLSLILTISLISESSDNIKKDLAYL